MPKKLVSKKIQETYKKTIQQLILDLSEPLVVVQESPNFITCPNCLWDSINKKSSNVYNASFTGSVVIFQGTDQERTINATSFTTGRCPICLGEGQLFTSKEICIPALINYFTPRNKSGDYIDFPAGKEGSSVVVVKTHSCHYDLLRSNNIFVIHNYVKCEKFKPPFVRGLGGVEAICEMWLQTSEVSERTSGKFVSDPMLTRNVDPRRKIKGPSDLRVLRGQLRGRDD